MHRNSCSSALLKRGRHCRRNSSPGTLGLRVAWRWTSLRSLRSLMREAFRERTWPLVMHPRRWRLGLPHLLMAAVRNRLLAPCRMPLPLSVLVPLFLSLKRIQAPLAGRPLDTADHVQTSRGLVKCEDTEICGICSED